MSKLALLLIAWLALAAAAVGAASWRDYERKPDEWFRSLEGRAIITNVLSWQTPRGDWPKNTDTFSAPPPDGSALAGTFDNGATVDELRFLARAFAATTNPVCQQAALKGVRHILSAQYPNGGWPQTHSARAGTYARHITFNDDTMTRLLRFTREAATSEAFAFLGNETRREAALAFERGVDCILRCQIIIHGKRTAWCAQHDEQTLEPRAARSFELVSLSGSETVGIVRLLMSLESPSPEIRAAIEGAVAWLESAALSGLRVEQRTDASGVRDRIVVADPKAPRIWARFYDIETQEPFFCGRDGVKKKTLAEIEHERRNGYSWLTYAPEKLLSEEHPQWKKRWSAP